MDGDAGEERLWHANVPPEEAISTITSTGGAAIGVVSGLLLVVWFVRKRRGEEGRPLTKQTPALIGNKKHDYLIGFRASPKEVFCDL